jgi:hypothetical protein
MSCNCGTLELITENLLICFPVVAPTVLEIVQRGPQGPAGSGIDPLSDRPTTLNEVIAGGVTLGLWP